MSRTVEIYFDFLSPPSYLAWTQLPGILERTGASAVWRPMFTIGLHQLTENRSPVMVPNKARWIAGDLQRFARRYGVTLNPNPHGIINILPADRAAALAEKEGAVEQLMATAYPAMWVDGRDLSDPKVLGEVIAAAGLDAARYLAAIETDEVKNLLKQNTQEAADRGAFGAPTFFVGDEMFFGQDRLDFVEEALAVGSDG
ncbi:MAG: 2-hydroxychromene-2-carboxylate isomerase [Pseudomonadales bacterium]|nr:2-hydroxychromene-2-carboxylate isomerase [Pseudomonadales bacterium]NIX08589.1 2-hydroxychromene-2-carboxylate isomerase [Pseudomonadales bacterium]